MFKRDANNAYKQRALQRITADDYAKSGTEHAQQVALFMWANESLTTYPMLKWLFAIPNGGQRNIATASLLKASGVKRGVADVFLPYPVGKWHGLFIEMKKLKGKQSEFQIQFKSDLIDNGYGVATCFSFAEAKQVIVNYINHAN